MGLLGSVTVVTGSNRTHHAPPRTGIHQQFLEGSYKHVVSTDHPPALAGADRRGRRSGGRDRAPGAGVGGDSQPDRTTHGARHRRSSNAGHTGSATGLGQLSGLLPASHLTEESAIQVNLSNETVRLPIYPGDAPDPNHPGQTEKVWYLLLDASDQGLAHDLGVNYAPKLANIGIGCPACVQTVTEGNPSPQANPFGPAVIHFAGAPDFSPTRVAVPGPTGFPLKSLQPGAVAGPGYSPFIRIAGSDVVYNAPIIATGDGPYDVVHHANTGDRVLRIHVGGPSAARPVLGVVGRCAVRQGL